MAINYQSLNLTFLFAEPISAFDDAKVKKSLGVEEESENFIYMQAGNNKMFAFQEMGVEILFEPNRLLISHRKSNNSNPETVVNLFERIRNEFERYSLKAYGFNADLSIRLEEEVDFNNFYNKSLIESLNSAKRILGGKLQIRFEQEESNFSVEVALTGRVGSRSAAHTNKHFETKTISEKDELTRRFKDFIEETNKMIEKFGIK